METVSTAYAAGAPRQKLEFRYDALGRRIGKKVYHYASGWVLDYERRFLYDGWNLIEELNVAGATLTPLRTFAWGLDHSGSRQGAGGIGGLLKVTDMAGANSYLPLYDGNGNVMGMIKAADGSIAATYEYDAFGRTLRESGPFAANNPIRFSSKYTDGETGEVYYGLRYYSPVLGRFINRDPIGERGGLNLYAFVGNDGVNQWDYLGMIWINTNCRSTYATDWNGERVLLEKQCDLVWLDEPNRSGPDHNDRTMLKEPPTTKDTQKKKAPNNEALKKECAELSSIIARGENKMHDLRKSFDSKSGYYRGLAKNFAKDNGEYLVNAVDFISDLGGEAFNYATGKVLPGSLNDVVGSLTDTVTSANGGADWSTVGHLTLATYYVKNLVRPAGNFKGISRFGGGALLIGGLAIKGYEHFGSTIYNEWQQNSIMQTGYDELYSLRSQYSTEEYHVGKFQEQYKAKGCDKL